MEPSTRVCPFCGEPPGPGVFCATCGRNLGGVERLPTAAEWTADSPREAADPVAAFLDAMHAAGDPGVTELPAGKPTMLGRTRRVQGWVVRPVDREDFEKPARYEPGLFLTVDGAFHRLDSELRGWGQRDFPRYVHTASAEPVDVPVDGRLSEELAAVLAATRSRPADR